MPDQYMSGRMVTTVSSSADSQGDPELKIWEDVMGNGKRGRFPGTVQKGKPLIRPGESHRGNHRYTG